MLKLFTKCKYSYFVSNLQKQTKASLRALHFLQLVYNGSAVGIAIKLIDSHKFIEMYNTDMSIVLRLHNKPIVSGNDYFVCRGKRGLK